MSTPATNASDTVRHTFMIVAQRTVVTLLMQRSRPKEQPAMVGGGV